LAAWTLVVDGVEEVVDEVVETVAEVVVVVVATVVVGGVVGSVDDPSQPDRNSSKSAVPARVLMALLGFSARACTLLRTRARCM
jgi:hypothetical protein